MDKSMIEAIKDATRELYLAEQELNRHKSINLSNRTTEEAIKLRQDYEIARAVVEEKAYILYKAKNPRM